MSHRAVDDERLQRPADVLCTQSLERVAKCWKQLGGGNLRPLPRLGPIPLQLLTIARSQHSKYCCSFRHGLCCNGAHYCAATEPCERVDILLPNDGWHVLVALPCTCRRWRMLNRLRVIGDTRHEVEKLVLIRLGFLFGGGFLSGGVLPFGGPLAFGTGLPELLLALLNCIGVCFTLLAGLRLRCPCRPHRSSCSRCQPRRSSYFCRHPLLLRAHLLLPVKLLRAELHL